MKEIPSVMLRGYSDLLAKRSVPANSRPYYLKWLRYYLDYCAKYDLSAKSSKSLTHFLQKLDEKKQAEFQQKQAGHAISIYLDMERANDRIPTTGKATAPLQPPLRNPRPPGAEQIPKAPKPAVIDQESSPTHAATVRQPLTFKDRLQAR